MKLKPFVIILTPKELIIRKYSLYIEHQYPKIISSRFIINYKLK